jgi:hypothetical protein
MSKKYGVNGTDSGPVAARVAVRDPVTWNASGRPSVRSAISSPSSTT